MARKKISRSKRKRQLDLLDLPNELLLSILQWCDPVTVHMLGCANKQLRTLTNHYTFHRTLPIPSPSSAPVPDITQTTRLQLHPAILHAAWRPAFGYDDIQIMMGLRTYDLVGSGIEEQAATDPPIKVCNVISVHVSTEFHEYIPPERGAFRQLTLLEIPRDMRDYCGNRMLQNQSSASSGFLTVKDILMAFIPEVYRIFNPWYRKNSQIYRVPLRTAFVVGIDNGPILTLAMNARRDIRYTTVLDPTGKRFRTQAPAKRLGYGLRSSGIAPGADLP